MTDAKPLDSRWIAANPLPVHGGGTDKNSRGRVVAIGGSAQAPGAVRLTAEAALRVGAGKVQMATMSTVATLLGLLVPETGVIALPEKDGEIAPDGDALKDVLANVDAVVIGPGMASREATARVLACSAEFVDGGTNVVLDAAAIAAANDSPEMVQRASGRLVMTPHHGEMAALTGEPADKIAADPAGAAVAAARRYDAVVALKGTTTVIAAPDGRVWEYAGGGVGMATGGSGDVLAGVVAGLLARGAGPLEATAWGVWLHGHSGRRMAARHGPIGFLARELLPELPLLLPQ